MQVPYDQMMNGVKNFQLRFFKPFKTNFGWFFQTIRN